MRACAGTQLSRRRVRAVLCNSAFLTIPPLPSIDSATSKPVSFADFVGANSESDFSGSCIIGFGSSPSRCGPSAHTATGGQAGDLPVRVQGVCVHARFYDHAGSPACLRWRTQTYGLPLHRLRRHPVFVFFRGSMAGLPVPLPMLRRHPHECLRTAWGRCGSLFLHRRGLAPLAPCRSPGAPVRKLPHSSNVATNFSTEPAVATFRLRGWALLVCTSTVRRSCASAAQRTTDVQCSLICIAPHGDAYVPYAPPETCPSLADRGA
jgi:hypothetical protein